MVPPCEETHVSDLPLRYLFVSVRNRAFKYLDHQRVVQRSHAEILGEGEIPAMSQSPPPPDDTLQAEELSAAVERVLARLPARCRQAHTIHREAGKSYAEIVRIMTTLVRAVETQIARARRTLRQEIAEWM